MKRKLVYRDQKDKNYTLKYNYLPENNPWINLSTQFSYSKTTQNDTRLEKAPPVFLGTLGNQSWITYSDLTFDIITQVLLISKVLGMNYYLVCNG